MSYYLFKEKDTRDVVCKSHPALVHDEDYNCDICLGPTPIKELIKKWRDERSLLIKQRMSLTMSRAWELKDEERIDCLEKCANELEKLL